MLRDIEIREYPRSRHNAIPDSQFLTALGLLNHRYYPFYAGKYSAAHSISCFLKRFAGWAPSEFKPASL